MSEYLLNIENLSTGYHGKIVQGPISIRIEKGKLIGIKGRNGKGKTTLLKTIAGLQKPISGKIFIAQQDFEKVAPADKAKLVSIVLTDRIKLSGVTVYDLVEMGRYPSTGKISFKKKEDDLVIDECIAQMKIQNLAKKALSEISDGELQKAMIARALAQETPIILMDEPTAFLDYVAKEELFVLLRQIVMEKKVTIIFTSHDIELMEKNADQIIEIA
jgi:iron complex transport system ATP-binding protein